MIQDTFMREINGKLIIYECQEQEMITMCNLIRLLMFADDINVFYSGKDINLSGLVS